MNNKLQNCIDYLNNIPGFYEADPIAHTNKLLDMLGNPQEGLNVIHVAGTNGKGSVCAYMHSLMGAASLKSGLFTSPHLLSITERFCIGENTISEEEFVEVFDIVRSQVELSVNDGMCLPTYFEFLFLMAMVYFSKMQVDVVVLETGLGGRIDCTNVIKKPLVCIITSISRDHMQYLGNTIPEIASEKAGIIKYQTPVVYDNTDTDAAAVISDTALKMKAKAHPVGFDSFTIVGNSDKGIDFLNHSDYYKRNYRTGSDGGCLFHISSPADYQAINASLALEAFAVLLDSGFAGNIGFDKIYKAIDETLWQGRMERILPGVILDGAHNPDGIEAFIRTAKRLSEGRSVSLLFAAVSDKDIEPMIERICSEVSLRKVYVSGMKTERALLPSKLARIFDRYGIKAEEFDCVSEAFDYALERKGDDILFCAGSLYLIGEIKEHLG